MLSTDVTGKVFTFVHELVGESELHPQPRPLPEVEPDWGLALDEVGFVLRMGLGLAPLRGPSGVQRICVALGRWSRGLDRPATFWQPFGLLGTSSSILRRI